MKKLSALLMSLILLMAALSAQAETVADNWFLHLYGISESSAVCASAFNAKWDLQLHEDGTGLVSIDMPMMGVSADDDCTWKLSDDQLTVTAQNASQTFTLQNNKLYAHIDGTTLIWLRGELPPEYSDDVPTLSNLDVSAFDGKWNCARITIHMNGFRMPLEVTNITADLLLEEGNGQLTLMQDNTQPMGLKLGSELSETVEGTALTIYPLDENIPSHIVLMLREDGVMVGTEMENGKATDCTYYFRLADE